MSPRQEDHHNWELYKAHVESNVRQLLTDPTHQDHRGLQANSLSAQPSISYTQFTHPHQMSCIYLEITSGPAWGLMNSKTAGSSIHVFSVELSAALCLSAACFISLSLVTTAAAEAAEADMPGKENSGLETVKVASLLLLPTMFHVQSRSPQSGWLKRKAISLTAWLLFQGSAALLRAPRLPALPLGYSGNHGWYWAVLSSFCAYPRPRCGRKE